MTKYLLLTLLVVLGCTHAFSSVSKPPGGVSTDESSFKPRSERYYETKPAPEPARSLPQIRNLEEVVLDLAHRRGLRVEPDGRLCELADYVLAAMDPEGTARLPATVIDAAARRLGLVEPVPFNSLFSLSEGRTLSAMISEALDSAPASLHFNRYGVAVRPWGATTVYIVVFSSVGLNLEPVARHVDVGHPIRVRGDLRDR